MSDAETRACIRWLLTRQLDPSADIDRAAAWCERWLARTAHWRRPGDVYTPERLAHLAVGAYRREHPNQLDAWTRVLSGL